MNKLMMVICDKEGSEPLILAKAKSIATPLHVDVKVLHPLRTDRLTVKPSGVSTQFN